MDFEEWAERIGVHPEDEIIGPMRLAWERATKIEREACAKVCDEIAAERERHNGPHFRLTADECAQGIRARGSA